MATFGQGVNASLGKTDYSNYLAGALQGARGVAAGGSAIGQGIASGIKKYGENKKINSAMEGGIKTAQSNLEGMLKFEGLGEGAKKTITDTLAQLNDPMKSVSERNAIAQQATNSAVNLINIGQEFREKEQAENERIATNQVVQDALTAGRAGTRMGRSTLVSNLLEIEGMNIEKAYDIADNVSPMVDELAAAKTRAETAKLIKETSLLGEMTEYQRQSLEQAKNFNDSGLEFNREKLELAREEFEAGKEISAYQRELIKTANSHVDIARAKLAQGERITPFQQAQLDQANRRIDFDISEVERVKAEDASNKRLIFEKEARVAKDTIKDLERIIERIDLAEGLIKTGAGGMEASVTRFLPFSAAAQLDAIYAEIVGNIAIDTLMTMKKNSPNGSTGFGQLNEKEFDAIISSRGRLRSQDATNIQAMNLADQKNFYKRTIQTLKEAYQPQPPPGFEIVAK